MVADQLSNAASSGTPDERQAGVSEPQQTEAGDDTPLPARPKLWDWSRVEHDIDQAADAEQWSLERRQRAKAMAADHVRRDGALYAQHQQRLLNAALARADSLGRNFTDISQLGLAYARLGPVQQSGLRRMAAANRSPREPATYSRTAVNLQVTAAQNPEAFVKKDLRPLRPYLTAREYAGFSALQKQLGAKPPEVSPRGLIDFTIRRRGHALGLDIFDGSDAEQLRQYGKIADIMLAYLDRSGTKPNKLPEQQLLDHAFDSAVMPVILRGGGWFGRDKRMRRFELQEGEKRLKGIPIPRDVWMEIADSLRAAGEPVTQDRVGQIYLSRQGKPGHWD